MKNRTGFVASIIGISLVLYLVGLAAGVIAYINELSDQYRSGLLVEVVLEDKDSSAQTDAIRQALQTADFCREVKYVSREEAAQTLSKDLGENFLEVLGYNPLYASFHLYLKSDYLQATQLTDLKKKISSMKGVAQVNVQENVLERIETKIKNTTLVILLFAALLLVFSVLLIFNTIRLAMYSGRQTIYSMLLIGATRWFVMKPFLGRSIGYGIFAAVIAVIMLVATGIYMQYQFPEASLQVLLPKFGIIACGLLLFGVLISLLSTWIAVNRYLRFKQEII